MYSFTHENFDVLPEVLTEVKSLTLTFGLGVSYLGCFTPILQYQRKRENSLVLYYKPTGDEDVYMRKLYQEKLKDRPKVFDIRIRKIHVSKNPLIRYFNLVISMAKTVDTLVLTSCLIGDREIQMLFPLISRMKVVNLTENRIQDEGAMFIAQYLCRPDTAIQTLDLSRNLITDKGVLSILQSLECNTVLSAIYVGSNRITQDCEEQVKAIRQKRNERFLEYSQEKNTLLRGLFDSQSPLRLLPGDFAIFKQVLWLNKYVPLRIVTSPTILQY